MTAGYWQRFEAAFVPESLGPVGSDTRQRARLALGVALITAAGGLAGVLVQIRFGTSTAPPGVDRSQDFFQGAERALSFIRLEELRAIGDRHSAEIIGLPGLVDFGIGLDAPNRRLVFVALAEDGADIPAVPRSPMRSSSS